jgi:hypothetical protein
MERCAGRGHAAVESWLSCDSLDADVPIAVPTPFGVDADAGRTGAILADESGTLTERYTRVSAPAPTLAHLKDLVGTYASEEADATVTIELQGASLVLTRRPARRITLIPEYPDAFAALQMGTLIFRRDRCRYGRH